MYGRDDHSKRNKRNKQQIVSLVKTKIEFHLGSEGPLNY